MRNYTQKLEQAMRYVMTLGLENNRKITDAILDSATKKFNIKKDKLILIGGWKKKMVVDRIQYEDM